MSQLPLLLRAESQTAVADTVVTVASRDTLDVIYALAAASVALTFFALFATLIYVYWEVRQMGRRVEALRERVTADPGVESLRKVAANVEAISHSARREVEHLTQSVSRLGDRLTQASDRMEERIEEFNALMEVIQQEAEGAFVDTVSAARGVQTGLKRAGRGVRTGASPKAGARRDLPGLGEDGGASRTPAKTDLPHVDDEAGLPGLDDGGEIP